MLILMLVATAMWGKDMHLFDIKSGIVEYKTTGNSNIMGIKSSISGTKKLVFDRYGGISLTEEQTVTHTSGMGQNRTDKTHTKTLVEGDMITIADMIRKKMLKRHNTAGQMLQQQGQGKTMLQQGKEMMKKMGGKKIGTGKVLGYPCEIWELMGTKIYMYKGVPLKVEANIMGIKSVEVATRAKFNVPVPKSAFKMPNFPLEQGSAGAPGAPGDMGDISPEQMEQMMQMIQQMQKAMGQGQ